MRILIAATMLAGMAGLAAGRNQPHVAQLLARSAHVDGFVKHTHDALKKRADLLGLCAYLAAINRGLPDWQVVQGAYQPTSEGQGFGPFWGSPEQLTSEHSTPSGVSLAQRLSD